MIHRRARRVRRTPLRNDLRALGVLGGGCRTSRMVSRILVALVAMSAVGLAAQQPPPPPAGLKTGNPTPGTPQPEPPNLAMRITVVGCVQATGNRSGGGAAANANTPSDARFVLTNAARTNVVPPGTGTATAGIESPDRIYRLHAIDSQLSPFVGAKVEISGE